MIDLIQNSDPYTLKYLCNNKTKTVTYNPLVINGRVINDNQTKSIQILYNEKIIFPYLKDKELNEFIVNGEVKIKKKVLKYYD